MSWLLKLAFIFIRAVLRVKIQQPVKLILKNKLTSTPLPPGCPPLRSNHSPLPAGSLSVYLQSARYHAYIAASCSADLVIISWFPALEGEDLVFFPVLTQPLTYTHASLQLSGLDFFDQLPVFNPTLTSSLEPPFAGPPRARI